MRLFAVHLTFTLNMNVSRSCYRSQSTRDSASRTGSEGPNWSSGDGVADGAGDGHSQREDSGRVSWSNADSVSSLGQGNHQASPTTFSQSATVSEDSRDVSVTVTRASDKETSPETNEESAEQSCPAGTSLGLAWDWSEEDGRRDWSAETTTKDWSASPPPPQEIDLTDRPLDRDSPTATSENQPDHNELAESDAGAEQSGESAEACALLQELIRKNNYNPTKFDIRTEGARYFVIKSYSEDDVHRSIKYSIWCSTERGNKKLDMAFRDQQTRNGDQRPIYLFYSVNGSGYFCGMAQMTSAVDYNVLTGVWAQDKWKGTTGLK